MRINNYMAIIRNIRNCLDEGVSEDHMKLICEAISTPKAIKNSKLLPFRFFSAYREIESNGSAYTSKVLDALETALDLSIENLPKLEGTTFIISDNSGSMDSPLSEKSTVSYKDVSNLMMCLSHKICEFPITMAFAADIALVNLAQRNGIISNTKQLDIEGSRLGGSTDAWKTMQYLLDKKLKVDRIILFSDMQCYNNIDYYGYRHENVVELFKKYKSSINPNVYLYSVDLSGYGTIQVPQDEPRTCLLAGWSERILEFIKMFEEDKKQVIERIKNGKEKLDDSDLRNASTE